MSATLDELKALTQILRTAQDQLADGAILAMDGVETRVAALCQSIEQATPEEQQASLPELTALMDHFALYEQELRRFQKSLVEDSHD